MRNSDQNSKRQGRRDFLRKIAVAGGSAAAVAAASKTMAAPAEPQASEAPSKSARYAETEHVRAYYRTCRS
ncbi:MAG: twin-arginine translocation signal domain-containing protein [Gammaproteobacteria bacterium]|nr:twin-arginine translocation signal domain-containing protein [Gammaproteobacteria bacterium]